MRVGDRHPASHELEPGAIVPKTFALRWPWKPRSS